MNQLFTFNSAQFQALQTPPSLHNHFRKRIIRTHQAKRQPSLVASQSTSSGNNQQAQPARSNQKSVSFKEPAGTGSPASKENIQSSFDNFPQSGQKQENLTERTSARYSPVLFKKYSGQYKKESQEIGPVEDSHPSVQDTEKSRRRRRFRSLKVGPKVSVPLSDRKLPKVFKMGTDDLIFPVCFENPNIKRRDLNANQQPRQIYSSQRRRILVEYRQVQKQSIAFIKQQKNFLTPRV